MLDTLKFLLFVILLFITIMLNQNVTSKKSGERDLSQFWRLENENGTLKLDNLTLPSGVYTALEQGLIIESILDLKNDITTKWIARDNWTFSLDIPCNQEELNYTNVILTLHGVDTFAEVFLNGELIGETENMFVRYRFNVKQKLRNESKNFSRLAITIRSPITEAKSLSTSYQRRKIVPECPPPVYNGECHVNLIRKMQASFAWDWGLAAPSMGIWKPVRLEFYNSIKIRDITFSLTDEETHWKALVGVYLETGTTRKNVIGTLTFKIFEVELNLEEQIVSVNRTSSDSGELLIENILTIPKEFVKLWWPNGYGTQKLYNLYVKWEDNLVNSIKVHDRETLIAEKVIRIGFRNIKLSQEETTDGLMFYFVINGIPIFMKGSNWIPSSVLPESSYDENYVKFLLYAAHDANMNMLRVWGGGVYESDYFYQLADELGILLWHDLMFACSMYPANEEFLANVAIEVNQNVRRIQHHPSVAIWATNNENEVALRQNWYNTNPNEEAYIQDYKKLYVELIQAEISKVDKWRPIVISSPSNGILSVKEDYIAQNPQDPRYGDVHYYNYVMDGWNPIIYRGGRFISEYGFQSFPAFTSWPVRDLSIPQLSDLIKHRQHSPLGNVPILQMIEKNLPMPSVNSSSYWRDVIYLSQVSQAMIVKTETEVYRSKRVEQGTMGALYWQLNDVWISPSWSSIEYGGKFKILHYWLSEVFAQNHVVAYINALKKLELYLIRDTLGPSEHWSIEVKVHRWDKFVPVDLIAYDSIVVPENTVVKVDTFDIYDRLRQNNRLAKDHLLRIDLYRSKKKIAENFVFLDKIRNADSISNVSLRLNIVSVNCNKVSNIVRISLEVTIDCPAVFVYLELTPENSALKQCQFSKNGFLQFTPIQTVHMQCVDIGCKSKLLSSDITPLTVNQVMSRQEI
ncbi:beta-mannosidase-like isoform X2 [Malaya genurostris]|uniref:beta-mannosidase-like isoform X2 n=1 Tax=Malaya genurostris TaxID=325434 RepID=UPI0026F38C87|nr:beta-mannosidase-like isoform X2 [Malaya genurostris]